MILAVTHPEVAFRDCAHCLRFIYDEATGEPEMRNGSPLLRGKAKPRCQTAVGCPKGTPDNQQSLSRKNQRALAFHRRCQAVNRWPEDSVVEINAAIIVAAESAGRLRRERERARRQRRPDY